MKRKAKKSIAISDLIDYILEDYEYDYLPYLQCPVAEMRDSVSITFCATKCWVLCWKFRRFHFVVKECDEVGCSEASPCPSCVEKIEDFKEIICKIRAIFWRRQREQSVNKKAKEFVGISVDFEEIRYNP